MALMEVNRAGRRQAEVGVWRVHPDPFQGLRRLILLASFNRNTTCAKRASQDKDKDWSPRERDCGVANLATLKDAAVSKRLTE